MTNCCVVALNLFSSDIITRSADTVVYIIQYMTHKLRGVHVEEHAYCVNKFRENVGLET